MGGIEKLNIWFHKNHTILGTAASWLDGWMDGWMTDLLMN
jgi:hypothetical protein